MGPLVSQEHAQKVRDYITSGVEQGATLVVDGRDFVCKNHEQGYFVGPTLFDQVKAGMRIYDEEIFGPGFVCGSSGILMKKGLALN